MAETTVFPLRTLFCASFCLCFVLYLLRNLSIKLMQSSMQHDVASHNISLPSLGAPKSRGCDRSAVRRLFTSRFQLEWLLTCFLSPFFSSPSVSVIICWAFFSISVFFLVFLWFLLGFFLNFDFRFAHKLRVFDLLRSPFRRFNLVWWLVVWPPPTPLPPPMWLTFWVVKLRLPACCKLPKENKKKSRCA